MEQVNAFIFETYDDEMICTVEESITILLNTDQPFPAKLHEVSLVVDGYANRYNLNPFEVESEIEATKEFPYYTTVYETTSLDEDGKQYVLRHYRPSMYDLLSSK